jgi:uncharacterized membrane protein
MVPLMMLAACSSAVPPAEPTAPPADPAEPSHDAHPHPHPPTDTATAGADAAPHDAGTPTPAPDPERAAYERAKPVLDKYCAGCHTTGAKGATKKALEHFTMDGYPFGGHHAAEMAVTMRKVLGASGKKATMPRGNPGAVQGDELASVLAWADAFEAAHPPAAKKPAPHKH